MGTKVWNTHTGNCQLGTTKVWELLQQRLWMVLWRMVLLPGPLPWATVLSDLNQILNFGNDLFSCNIYRRWLFSREVELQWHYVCRFSLQLNLSLSGPSDRKLRWWEIKGSRWSARSWRFVPSFTFTCIVPSVNMMKMATYSTCRHALDRLRSFCFHLWWFICYCDCKVQKWLNDLDEIFTTRLVKCRSFLLQWRRSSKIDLAYFLNLDVINFVLILNVR